MRGFAGLAAAVLLAGCATGVPVENEVIVTGQNFANVQGEARLVVRTFVEEADGPHEVLGATCQMVSSLFDATVTTPARLVVPNFGPQSPELVFECQAGELSGGARRKIVTTWQYPPGALAPGWGPGFGGPWGGMGWGAGWGGGWWAPPAIPVSRYPNVDVLLR
jgi:hypothetical protein